MQVLEHEHRRRSAPQLADEGAHDVVGLGAGGHDFRELAAGELGDVEQRPQRTRREQRLAGTPEKPRPVAVLFAEPPQERGLSYSGLTGNQHEPAVRAG